MSQLPKPVITNDDFNELLEVVATYATELLRDQEVKSLMPTVHIFGLQPAGEEDDEATGTYIPAITVAGLTNFDADHRHHILHTLGQAMWDEQKMVVEAVFFVAESWLSQQPRYAPRRYAQAADDPNRREVISISGMTFDGRQAAATVSLTRTPQARMVPGAIKFMRYGDPSFEVHHHLCAAFFDGCKAAALADAV